MLESLLTNLHEVTKGLLTEDIFEEDQVLLMVGVRVQLGGEQGQSLMQPCISTELWMSVGFKHRNAVDQTCV